MMFPVKALLRDWSAAALEPAAVEKVAGTSVQPDATAV